mgnify:FL=1
MEKAIKKGFDLAVWTLKGMVRYTERLFTRNLAIQGRWIKNIYIPQNRAFVSGISNEVLAGFAIFGALIAGCIVCIVLILWSLVRSLVP